MTLESKQYGLLPNKIFLQESMSSKIRPRSDICTKIIDQLFSITNQSGTALNVQTMQDVIWDSVSLTENRLMTYGSDHSFLNRN